MASDREMSVSGRLDLDKLLQIDRGTRIIRLQIPTLSDRKNTEYQKKLTLYHNECGCNAGALLSVVAVSIYFLILIVEKITTGTFYLEWGTIVTVILVFVLSAGLGKLIGIMNAKIRYRNLVKKIERIT